MEATRNGGNGNLHDLEPMDSSVSICKRNIESEIVPNEESVIKKKKFELYGLTIKMCPVTKCGMHFRLPTVLHHFLTAHQSDALKAPIKEVRKNKVVRIIKKGHPIFQNDDIYCLGVMLYGGKQIKVDDLPTKQNISDTDFCLPLKYIKYTYFCPIFLFGKRVSSKSPSNLNDEYVYVFWSSGYNVTDKIHTRLIASDIKHYEILETLCKIRDFADTQDPAEFIFRDYHLHLFKDDIERITSYYTENLHITFYIEED